MRSIWPKAILGTAALCSIVTALHRTGNNGDLMYLESLYHHLHVLGLPLGNFVFTEAFFWFPDAVLYWPLRAVTRSQEVAAPAFYLANLGLTLWGLARLYDRAWPTHDRATRASCLAFFVLVLTMVPRLNLTLFWPNHHGALMPVFFGLTLLLDARPSAGRLLVAFFVAAATVASDGVSLMQVFAPLLAYLAWRRAWINCVGLALGVGQGMVTLASLKQWSVLRFQTSSLMPTLRSFAYEWQTLPDTLVTWATEAWAFHAVTLLFVLTVGFIRAERRANLRDVDRIFALAIGLTIVITLGMARASSIYSIRYVQNFYYLSAAGVAVTILPEFTAHAVFRAWFPRVLVAYALAVGTVHAAGGFKFFDHGLSRCVDAAVPRGARGLGEFWAAKLLTFTSHHRVDQIDYDFTKYLWMNSERWYDERATFFVTEPGDALAAVTAHYGDPRGSVVCPGGKLVLLYPNGLAEPL